MYYILISSNTNLISFTDAAEESLQEALNTISSSMLTIATVQSSSKLLLGQTLRQLPMLSNLSDSCCSRHFHVDRKAKHVIVSQQQIEEGHYKKEELPIALWGLTDSRILYSSHVKDSKAMVNPAILRIIGKKIKLEEQSKRRDQAIPLIIEQNIVKCEEKDHIESHSDEEPKELKVFYPYSHTEQIDIPKSYTIDSDPMELESTDSDSDFPKPRVTVEEEIAVRMKAYDKGVLEELDTPKGNLVEDQDTHDFNTDIILEDGAADLQLMREQQGSADPNYPVSDVPCGGCGAFLHCQQPSLMGKYLTYIC